MSATLRVSERVVGGGRVADAAAGLHQTATFGLGVFPSRTWSLAYGTATGEANQWYLGRRTCAAGGTDHLDLAGGLTNPVTGTVTLTYVKRVLIRLIDPDGTKKLRVGPNGVSNAVQLWFGGTGSGQYVEVVEELDVKNQFGGWAVTAGAGDILGVSNPGGADVSYAIWIIGRQ